MIRTIKNGDRKEGRRETETVRFPGLSGRVGAGHARDLIAGMARSYLALTQNGAIDAGCRVPLEGASGLPSSGFRPPLHYLTPILNFSKHIV